MYASALPDGLISILVKDHIPKKCSVSDVLEAKIEKSLREGV